jgi:hypothetical protein
MAGKLGKF